LFCLLLQRGVLLRQQRLELPDPLVALRQLLPQHPILFSQQAQFFFVRHTLTLPNFTPFDKSLAHVGSYHISVKIWYDVRGFFCASK
jgi:hypothetical protein